MKFLISIVLLAVFVVASSALKCHHCEYFAGAEKDTTSPNCDVTNADSNIITCSIENMLMDEEEMKTFQDVPEEEWQCMKKTGKTIKDGDSYTLRGCSKTGNSLENKCKESNALDTPFGMVEKGFKCFCNTEACNTGTKTNNIPIVILLLTTLFSYIIAFIL